MSASTLFDQPSATSSAKASQDAAAAASAAADATGAQPSTSAQPSAEGFLDRMASADTPEESSPLSEHDQETVQQARDEAAAKIEELTVIEETLRVLGDDGNEAAVDFFEDQRRDLVERRRKAIRSCYYDITTSLNKWHGTRFEAQRVFGSVWPVRPYEVLRNEKELTLASTSTIEEAIVDATEGRDLAAAGRQAVVDFFRSELSSYADHTVGKSYVNLKRFFHFDEYFPNSINYNNRETVEALAGAIWYFERGGTTAPSGVLSQLRGQNAHDVPQNEDLVPHPHCEKIENIVVHKNGSCKIRFTEPKYTRRFAQMFGLS